MELGRTNGVIRLQHFQERGLRKPSHGAPAWAQLEKRQHMLPAEPRKAGVCRGTPKGAGK